MRVHIMLFGRFSEGDLISPATAAIFVTPANERNTKAEAVPKLVTPSNDSKPLSENASPCTGLLQSKDWFIPARNAIKNTKRTEIVTIGNCIRFMLLTPMMLMTIIMDNRKIAISLDMFSVNSKPRGS